MLRKSSRLNARTVFANSSHPIEPLESRLLMAVFAVTNSNDSGAGSLRDALTRSNNTTGLDTIVFNITSASRVIRPASALPDVWDPAVVDATTQPGYAGAPLVQIDGAAAGANVSGLKLWGGSTVKGLSITRFTASAVDILGRGIAVGNIVQANWLGLDLSGAAAGNGVHGVGVYTGDNLIGGPDVSARNVISANNHGIFIQGTTASNNTVQNNYFGTDPSGTRARGNVRNGVGIQNAPDNWVLSNVISANGDDGIIILGSGATNNGVQSNLVGLAADGVTPLGNKMYGIEIQSAANTIGGPHYAQRNVFSANADAGIVLYTAGATTNLIRGNYIGTDLNGTLDLGNVWQGVAISGAVGNHITGNLISGNNAEGVGIFPGNNNTVDGNTIGFGATGANLPNGTWPATVINGSTGNVVTGNYIAKHPSGAIVSTGANTVSPNFAAPPVAPDVTPPRVLSATFVYDAPPQKLKYAFSEDVSASLSLADVSVVNAVSGKSYSPSSLAYDRQSNTATFTFVTPLPRGTYRASLLGDAITDATGNKLDGNGDGAAGGTQVLSFGYLPGDATGDGSVDFNDLARLSQNYNMGGKAWAQGDFTGDGVVDFNDLAVLSQNYNTSLSAAVGGAPIGAAVWVAGVQPQAAPALARSPISPKRHRTIFADQRI
ncbi:MAG TPA: NosD domain-containing protein [Tepidisphaeraceae bacterium]